MAIIPDPNSPGGVISELNWVGAIVVAGYIGTVIAQGNADQLFKEIKTETPFLEFVVALAILWTLSRNKSVGPAVNAFVIMALLALGLKIAANTNSSNALKEFGNGNAGLFETIRKVAIS